MKMEKGRGRDHRKEIGERIAQFCKKAGITFAELAERTGISRMTISNIKLGKVPLRWEDGIKIAKALGVSPYDIFGAEELGIPEHIRIVDELAILNPQAVKLITEVALREAMKFMYGGATYELGRESEEGETKLGEKKPRGRRKSS